MEFHFLSLINRRERIKVDQLPRIVHRSLSSREKSRFPGKPGSIEGIHSLLDREKQCKNIHDKSIVSFFQILVEESGNRLHCCLEEEILLYKIKNYTSQFLFNQETVTSSTRINLTRREGILIALYSRIKHIYIEKSSNFSPSKKKEKKGKES